jgi:hypothetical protein
VRLYFMEPDQHVRPGERVVDLTLQGRTAARGLDVVAEAGGPFRSIVKTFAGVPIADALTLELHKAAWREPVLCGVEMVQE